MDECSKDAMRNDYSADKPIKTSKDQRVFTGNKRLYNLKEASTYLGRSVWSVRELIWAGKLPIVRDGRRIFIDILDLEKFVENNKSTYI